MLEIREVTDEASIQRYESLNRTSPQGSVFSSIGWHRYNKSEVRLYGAYKGSELIAGALVPVVGGKVLRVVEGTPWTGPVSRSDDEGENLVVAEGLAQHLLREYGEVTLTLPPQWVDVRGFLWAGYYSHVRYTYRGLGYKMRGRTEKRLRVKSLRAPDLMLDTVYEGDGWQHLRMTYEDTVVDILDDWRGRYYWKANKGGSWHTELLDRMLKPYDTNDLVGCNSPHRGLFKRQFGGYLRPYYCVTTADPKEITEFWPPVEAAVA